MQQGFIIEEGAGSGGLRLFCANLPVSAFVHKTAGGWGISLNEYSFKGNGTICEQRRR